MRKAVLGICLLTFLSSCGDRKVKIDPFVAVTSMIDSVATKTKEERPAEPPADDKPIHTEADELFDDFFFTYASDSILQKQRTKFPLPYYIGDSAIKIQEGHWEYQRLFPDENFYTLLFDREEDMDLVGDTSLNSVQVEWFDLNSRLSRKLYFERIRGIWMLEAVNERAMHRGENGGFVDFYSRFAQDSLYQSSHISHTLRFVTIDPDDEFSILETTLSLNQWFAFRPMLPSAWLTNINYGQRNDSTSTKKILKVNGIGNGYSNAFHFKKREGEWILYKYEDTSI